MSTRRRRSNANSDSESDGSESSNDNDEDDLIVAKGISAYSTTPPADSGVTAVDECSGDKQKDKKVSSGKVKPERQNQKRDPAFVPRSGQFFLHDDRDSQAQSQDRTTISPGNSLKTANAARVPMKKSDDCWRHDKFNDVETTPTSSKKHNRPIKTMPSSTNSDRTNVSGGTKNVNNTASNRNVVDTRHVDGGKVSTKPSIVRETRDENLRHVFTGPPSTSRVTNDRHSSSLVTEPFLASGRLPDSSHRQTPSQAGSTARIKFSPELRTSSAVSTVTAAATGATKYAADVAAREMKQSTTQAKSSPRGGGGNGYAARNTETVNSRNTGRAADSDTHAFKNNTSGTGENRQQSADNGRDSREKLLKRDVSSKPSQDYRTLENSSASRSSYRVDVPRSPVARERSSEKMVKPRGVAIDSRTSPVTPAKAPPGLDSATLNPTAQVFQPTPTAVSHLSASADFDSHNNSFHQYSGEETGEIDDATAAVTAAVGGYDYSLYGSVAASSDYAQSVDRYLQQQISRQMQQMAVLGGSTLSPEMLLDAYGNALPVMYGGYHQAAVTSATPVYDPSMLYHMGGGTDSTWYTDQQSQQTGGTVYYPMTTSPVSSQQHHKGGSSGGGFTPGSSK